MQAEVSAVAVAAGTGNHPLIDETSSRVETTNRATHPTRDEVMRILDPIYVDDSWGCSVIGNNRIVPPSQIEVAKADCSIEFGREIESFSDSLFVVSNTKDSARHSLFTSL